MRNFAICLVLTALLQACKIDANESRLVGTWQIESITNDQQRTIVDRSKRDSMFKATYDEFLISYKVQEMEFGEKDSMEMVDGFEANWRMIFGKTYEFTEDGVYIMGDYDTKYGKMKYDTNSYSLAGNKLEMRMNNEKMEWEYSFMDGGVLKLMEPESKLTTYMSKVKN